MFLETLDVRKNDVLIYSHNRFDFNNNFKIVFKKEAIKRPRSISYFEVCEFVKEPTPKNLIVYRLLTNVQELDSYSTKYGYFIRIEGRMELIYFDPIFAIKDLRHLRFNLDPEKFRFKIQQVGLTYNGKTELEADFSEVFSFDLSAQEAQNQNDKIFADAIFAFDESFIEEEYEALSDDKISISSLTKGGENKDVKRISEDHQYHKNDFSKVWIEDDSGTTTFRDSKIEGLKKALGIEGSQKSQTFKFYKKEEGVQSQSGEDKKRKTSFSQFISEHKGEKSEEKEVRTDVPDLFSLFKTTGKKPEGRREVFLKLDES
jgi:hypothetical protein